MSITILLLKIVYTTNFNPFFESSASANRLRTLLEGLSKHRVEICLLIMHGYHSRQEFNKFGEQGNIGNIHYRYLCSLIHNKLWQRRINKYLIIPLIKPLILKKTKIAFKVNQHSLLWTGNELSFYKLVVELKRQNPQIKTFLEISEFMDIHDFSKGRLVHKFEGKRRQEFFERKAYLAYDGLALMTKTLMNHYMQFSKQGPKLIHLPMTVDLNRFNTDYKPVNGFDKPYIAFIGVMNDYKEGVNILIQAFAQIALKFPDYKLYLIGSWNYDTPLHQKLINELNMKERILWKGELPRDQIPPILMDANLLVLPRPDSKQAKGGFPTKLGEYLASGNPVCATRVGEIPDYLTDGETVFFAEPGSVNSFAKAMFRVLSNPEKAKAIGLAGRKIAELYFNQDIQAKILFDFLKDRYKFD